VKKYENQINVRAAASFRLRGGLRSLNNAASLRLLQVNNWVRVFVIGVSDTPGTAIHDANMAESKTFTLRDAPPQPPPDRRHTAITWVRCCGCAPL
jgi:hypothetical protein